MTRKVLLALITVSALAVILIIPPIAQNPHYHHFANRTRYFGIANFWNIASNIPFLWVAVAGSLRRKPDEAWKRNGVSVLLIGIAAVAFGSAYYHAQPSDERLFWDRLPMTIVFMSILTLTIGERISARFASGMVWPALCAGIASVLFWIGTGDLRPYAFVQFYPMLLVPAILFLFPKGQTSNRAYYGMICFYALAKAAEMFDGQLLWVPGGAHAWKHVFAALGIFVYVQALTKAPADSARVLPSDTPAANFAKRTSLESPYLSPK